jgi:hypothetical protein
MPAKAGGSRCAWQLLRAKYGGVVKLETYVLWEAANNKDVASILEIFSKRFSIVDSIRNEEWRLLEPPVFNPRTVLLLTRYATFIHDGKKFCSLPQEYHTGNAIVISPYRF